MASALAHALVAVTLGKTLPRILRSSKLWLLGILCSILPDADVLMFRFSIPYEHALGHRGFSHSLLFAFMLGLLLTFLFYRKVKLLSKHGMLLILFFFLSTASHALLDAMTTGGLGVAFFAPFDNNRYFLPWRPIQVSPIGAAAFFSEWGLRVIKSELRWVGLPCFAILMGLSLLRRTKRNALR